jgi:ATP-dependent Clp protease adapter protein ClpS
LDQVHLLDDHRSIGTGDICQVVLFNDNHNTGEHVMKILMMVFDHSEGMAKKLMMEAHKAGRTIAQVEVYEKARKHVGQLLENGLQAELEVIE